MANSMPTGQPVPEHEVTRNEWSVQELENMNGYNFITPKGYTFGFRSIRDALNFIVEMQYDGVYHSTKHGDKHYSEGFDIAVWTPDPWINKDWNHGDLVCRKQDLAEIILNYVYARWLKNL